MQNLEERLIKSLMVSPAMYAFGLSKSNEDVLLRTMQRHHFHQSTFLHSLIQSEDDLVYSVPLAKVLEQLNTITSPQRPIHFIFHFAFCGSTLLSRCIDVPGKSLVFREPYLLHQLSDFARASQIALQYPMTQLMNLAMHTFQKTFASTEVPIVKATDSCAVLAARCLQFHPDSRGIVLYQPLPAFLLATLKTARRRNFIRGMKARALDDLQSVGILLDEITTLSDAEMTGLVWFSLMHKFTALLSRQDASIKSLNKAHLISQPAAVLSRVASLFQIDLQAQLIEKTVQEGAFTRNAKRPETPFQQETYNTSQRTFQETYADEIAEGIEWVTKLRARFPIENELPQPLFE